METSEILDTSALIEGLKGVTTIFSIIEYPQALLLKPEILYPERKEYSQTVLMMHELYKRGTPINSMDVLIATMAIMRDKTIVTKDEHFKRIPKLRVRMI